MNYRELQSALKAHRNNGIWVAHETPLNSKYEVLKQGLIDSLKAENGLCNRKLELNPNVSQEQKDEWFGTIVANALDIAILSFNAN